MERDALQWTPIIGGNQAGERLRYKGEVIAEFSQKDYEIESHWVCRLAPNFPDSRHLNGKEIDVFNTSGKFGSPGYTALKLAITRWAQSEGVPHWDAQHKMRMRQVVKRLGPASPQKPMDREAGRKIVRQAALKNNRDHDLER